MHQEADDEGRIRGEAERHPPRPRPRDGPHQVRYRPVVYVSRFTQTLTPEHDLYRLIRGDGEVLEEIVTKERHKDINKVSHSVHVW